MNRYSKSALLICSALVSSLVAASAAHAQASPSAFTSATRYDSERRVVGTIAPDPDGAGPLHYGAVRNTYDTRGRLTKVEKGELSAWQSETVAPSAWTGFTVLLTTDISYDELNRKVKETLTGGGSVQTATQFSYDDLGRLQCTAVRMNPAVFASLPASACTLGTQGSFGPDRITKNVYDAASQLVQLREGVGSTVEAAEATYSFTANGKKEYVIDGEGAKARLVYDGHDRLSQWQFPSTTRPAAYNDSTQSNALATSGSVNGGDYEQYGYDANGNRTSLRKRDGQTIGYSFDVLNRMATKDLPGTSADVSYSYDLRGLQLTATFSASGQGLTNGYDGFGELTSAVTNVGGTSRTLSYQYDADGNRTRITHPDSNFFTDQYDGLNRLTNILEGASSNLITITYDQLGRRSSLARTGAGTTAYSYDNASRLSSLAHDLAATTNDQTLAFSYNPASQMVTRSGSNDLYAWTGHGSGTTTITINGLDQIANKGGTLFVYSSNGNLTSDGATTFAYDQENRLTSATGAKNATLAYDPNGRLIDVTSAGVATKLLYDGEHLVAEYNGSGTLARRYIHGDGADEPLVQYEGSGLATKRFLHSDHQGTVIAVTDAAGNSLAINRYDEYGVPQSTNSGRFGYTGQQYLPEIGLNYYKARMYKPSEGVFMQIDPLAYDDEMNLYLYAGADPLVLVDPSGREKIVYHYSNGQTVIVQTFDNQTQFTNAQISAQGANLSGAGTNGNLTVTLIPGTDATALKLRTNPSLQDLNNPNPYTRSHTDKIGGRNIEIAPDALPGTPGHEIGHSLRAGDQYKDGIDANGNVIPANIPGPLNIMRDAAGPANQQTVDEIINGADKEATQIRTCTVTVLETQCQ